MIDLLILKTMVCGLGSKDVDLYQDAACRDIVQALKSNEEEFLV